MALRNWRTWHWVALSLVVGAVLALAFSLQSPDDPSLPSASFQNMRAKLERRTDAGESVLTKIRVGPIVTDHDGNRVQSVTYWERQKNRNTGQWDLTLQYRVVTPVPLSPGSPTKDFGVLNYLADRKKDIPSLDYKYQWWLVPRNLWLICMGGSVLVIGIVWPIVLKGLVKLGLAEPPDERMDLSAVRVVDEPEDEPAPVVSAAEHQKLADLNAELEAKVGGMAMATAGEVKHAAVPEPVRLLNAEPIDSSAVAVEEKKADDFKGEFYPVARPVAKSD